MKVGPTLLHQLNDRLLKNIENELRTEALLKGEPYYHPISFLGELIPRKKHTYNDDILEVYKHASLYGSSMHTIAFKPEGTVPGRMPPEPTPQIQAPVVTYDDIEKLSAKLMANMIVDRSFDVFSGNSIHEVYFDELQKPQGALSRAEPNRGPQPRKPHIHRRK